MTEALARDGEDLQGWRGHETDPVEEASLLQQRACPATLLERYLQASRRPAIRESARQEK